MTQPASAAYFDLHTHILPGMDDGSRSCAQSVQMLERMKQQSIGFIAATPHYYADVLSPEEFFQKRASAWSLLRQEPICAEFEIRLGAEVQYYEGITRLEQPERFCLEGTDLFLLEMPFMPWSDRVLSDLCELNENPRLRVMLAHIERYLPFQPRHCVQALTDMDILLQSNAEFFLSFRTRGKALRMLRHGQLRAIGSDCHNLETRCPNVGQAMEVIGSRAGSLPLRDLLLGERELWDGGVRI